MESGRARLLWMHDAEQVLGVVERAELTNLTGSPVQWSV